MNVLFLKVIFILISAFLGRGIKWISNIKCVSTVVTENAYPFSFVTLVVITLRAAYLSIFLLYFGFFKNELQRERNGIFVTNINFLSIKILQTVTSG